MIVQPCGLPRETVARMQWEAGLPPHVIQETLTQRPLGSFSTDARQAITVSPDYFVRWYTLKSLGLGVAVGIIGYLLGRATAKR
jgi:hypothetical protein